MFQPKTRTGRGMQVAFTVFSEEPVLNFAQLFVNQSCSTHSDTLRLF